MEMDGVKKKTKEMDEMPGADIPDCLIIEIFARLPVKSLCRFKCVSKFYLSLIQDPSFAHRIQQPTSPILWQIQCEMHFSVYSIDSDGSSALEDSYEFEDDFEGFGYRDVGYCNGLNCFQYNADVGLCVFNIATKEYVALPRRCKNGIICFDRSSKKYKVLGSVETGDEMPDDFFVLTLGRDASWRPVTNPLGMDYLREPDAVINGEPFWKFYRRRIISFQPANEVFRELDFPDQLCRGKGWTSIFDFEGSLCLVEQHLSEEPTFSLWILKGGVWVALKKITLSYEGRYLDECYSRTITDRWTSNRFNFSSRGGELLVAVMGSFDHQFMFVYNFLNDQFKRVKITGLPYFDWEMSYTIGTDLFIRNYVENFVNLQELVSCSLSWHVNLSQKFHEMNEMVGVSLPDSLIIDIFSRLPVKSLCRFKCVSKFFLSLIQDPVFIDQIRPETPILWQIEKDKGYNVFSVDCNGFSALRHTCRYQDDFARFRLSDGRYCNGLNLNCFVYNDNTWLYVCNVTTKECITLPRWCNDCIFCFDPSTKKYKVLGWVEKNSQMPVDFCVLTLERDPSWKLVTNPLKVDFLVEPDVIIGGGPFWLYEDKRQIISFNPTKEEFSVIGLPGELNEETFWYCIFEFEGSLSLVEQHQREEPIFSLWILNGNGWVMMKKNIAMPFEGTNLVEYFSKPGIESWMAYSYNFSSHGGELLVAVVGDYDYQFMFRYNFLNNQFKRIKITGLPFCDLGGLRMRKFVENNVCLQELVWHH